MLMLLFLFSLCVSCLFFFTFSLCICNFFLLYSDFPRDNFKCAHFYLCCCCCCCYLLSRCSCVGEYLRARKQTSFHRMNEHAKNVYTPVFLSLSPSHSLYGSYKYQNFCHWIAKVLQYEMMYLHFYMFIQLMNTLCTLDTYIWRMAWQNSPNKSNGGGDGDGDSSNSRNRIHSK